MYQLLFRGLCLVVALLCASIRVTTAQEGPTFLEVAVERFEARVARSITEADKDWTFDDLQVIGCVGHFVDESVLYDPSIFSMSNLRDVVDRMVSGFFYAAPHSPKCARKRNVDYKECFEAMISDNQFRNVISKMFTGSYAYDSRTRVCWDLDSNGCTHDLRSVVRGACNLNYVTMCEVSSTSVLLLFETLPWIGPSEDYFPLANSADAGLSLEVEGRKNVGKKHEEGIQHITPELRAKALEVNGIDQAIYDLVSAKFCHRLREVGLLTHPLVDAELVTFEPLHERCTNSSWVESTLETFAPYMPEDCRLFQPVARPADVP